MRKFHLALHPEKTRLLEFCPFCDQQTGKGVGREARDIQLLGFTHICVKKRATECTRCCGNDPQKAASEAERGESRASAAHA